MSASKKIIAYPAYKNRATNPYQALLYTELENLGWQVSDLDTSLARLRGADILHLHWPDGFAFHRNLVKSLFRSCLILVLMSVYRASGCKVIWTVHNMRSHEQFHPRLEKWFWRHYYRRLDGWIALNRFTAETIRAMPRLRELPNAVIPHGLYPLLGNGSGPAPAAKNGRLRLLLFGKLRPYKELPLLVEAFAGLLSQEVELVIAGKCHDPTLAEFLERSARSVPNLTVILRFLPDDELDGLIRSADAVVVPYAGSLNSGVIFLALAYGKPVLAPGTPSFKEVEADFDSKRVHLFNPPLDTPKLADLLRKLNPLTDPLESPECYSWPHIAAQHDAFFEFLKP